jgi:23S rRNA (adenine1618-N6)-methyltransferase
MTKEMHKRNIHNEKYDYTILAKEFPSLRPFVSENQYGDLSVDFSDASAVLSLNQAILSHHYKVKGWTIPIGNLCPPIPGRVDYLHYIADLLDKENPPVGTKIKGLDIGTGTGCIYPILGNSVYGWKFVATDIDSESINHCKKILDSNPILKKNIKLRFQNSADDIFINIIKADEKFDFTMCNPPFHASYEEAQDASYYKVKNLNINKEKKGHWQSKISPSKASNFGGRDNELWCQGGESVFIRKMIEQSVEVKDQCRWFTTLVSNRDHLLEFNQQLENLNCPEVRTIKMRHGQKIVNILAWKFY